MEEVRRRLVQFDLPPAKKTPSPESADVSFQDAWDLGLGTLSGSCEYGLRARALSRLLHHSRFPKAARDDGPGSMVVKSLEEKVGQEAFVRYMPPNAPRGPIDVLKTPELLERARKA